MNLLNSLFRITVGALALIILIQTPQAQAASFCHEVLDSFDFEQGVFAGPDPDALPNRINEYIRTRVAHQVNKGQLSEKEAAYFLDSAMDEMNIFRNIADTCRREPGSGIRLVDRLLKPHFRSEEISQHQTAASNQEAHETLDAVWKACQIFWMEQDAPAPCVLDTLHTSEGTPFTAPGGLDVAIEDGSMTGFRARARHRDGNREYVMNAQGDIFETVVSQGNAE